MSEFEFVFSLFGLLLGLSVAEVMGGMARVLKSRHRIRVGWQTPLLGLLVTIDLVTFWSLAWAGREQIPVKVLGLFAGCAITAVYYLAASLTFPDELREGDDLDRHYEGHKRQVLGAVLVCNLATYALLAGVLGTVPIGVGFLVLMALYLVGLAAAILARGPRTNLALLAALIFMNMVSAAFF